MKTDVIQIDNLGNGFREAVEETKKAAEFQGLTAKQALHLQLFAEEMLSMAHSVTGEMKAAFWIESEDKAFDLHMTTQTVMDKEKRYLLISSSTAKKHEAASSFLGKLRDAIERAMASDVERTYFDLPEALRSDVGGVAKDQEWDRLERSVLLKLADDVKIAIRGKEVHLTVSKKFA